MSTMPLQEEIRAMVEALVKKTMDQPKSPVEGCFFFDEMEDCIGAAVHAARVFGELGMEKRRVIVDAMRAAAKAEAHTLAHAAFEETGYGSITHKIAKCKLAADKTPGVEDLEIKALSGDAGLTLTYPAPYGVIGSITPSTNPVATVVNNGLGMVAAGNAVVFAPHPGAKACSQLAIAVLNQAMIEVGCPVPMLYAVKNPDIASSGKLMNDPRVRMLAVTGGEAIVQMAMKTGKKVIGAGPGNPPVIVDETANIEQAAQDIVDGASFENNILCISEKETFVVEEVAGKLLKAMVKAGAQLIDPEQAERLLATVLVRKDKTYVINREFVGRDAAYLLMKAGIPVQGSPKLIVTVTKKEHPFVTTEMLMPVMPVVYVKNVEEAIACAVEAERGCHHSAHMHSRDVENLTKASRALDTTIFVKNAPSYAGVGFTGEGHCTFTIATPTGEGLTSARSFTRSRRCVLGDSFQMM